MSTKNNTSYEEYFKNRTVRDIMDEWGEHRSEWVSCDPGSKITEFHISTNDYNIPCKLFEPTNNVEFVVIGVHGFAGDKDSSILAGLANSLCKRNGALICFDFPAHGKSEAEDNYLRVNNCKRDLLQVVAHASNLYPNKKYGIFATSFGGYITLLCADKLKNYRKVLRAPAVTMADSFIEKIIPISKKEFLENGSAICGFERKMFVSSEFYADLLENPIKIPDEPLMIIHGTKDDIIPYKAVLKLTEEYTNITLISVNGADHRFKRLGDISLIINSSLEWFYSGQ